MVTRIAVAVAFSSLLFAECVEVPRYGDLDVVAIELTGTRLTSGIEIELFTIGGAFVRRTSGAHFAKLPYGDYRLKVVRSGFYTAWQDVRVAHATQTVRARLELDVECGPLNQSIGGKVVGMRSEEELWVKAIPLRGTGGAESRVDSNGQFLMADVPAGDYVLLVARGEAVVHQQVIKTYPLSLKPRSFVIDLSNAR